MAWYVNWSITAYQMLHILRYWMSPIPFTAQAFKVQWWMCHYTARTPKPHYGFSNSPRISKLNRGMLRGWVRKDESQGGVRTAETYRNSEGKLCYKGTKALRKTEPLDYKFWIVTKSGCAILRTYVCWNRVFLSIISAIYIGFSNVPTIN